MKQLFTLLCCAISFSGLSQSVNTSFSEPFDEPNGALGTKVFQCRNGNTLLFTFNRKDEIEVDVYNTAHKAIAHTTLPTQTGDPKNIRRILVDGIYNIDTAAVMFIEQVNDRKPTLNRLIISPETGRLINKERIAEMEDYTFGWGYKVDHGAYQPKRFYVEQDPLTDAYAVLAFDGFTLGITPQITLTHYDGTHKVLGSGVYSDPEDLYEGFQYLGMAVRGSQEIILCLNAKYKKEDGAVSDCFLLSTMTGQQFGHSALKLQQSIDITRSIFQYNTTTKSLQLLTLVKERTKGTTTYYAALLIAINPVDNSVIYGKNLDASLATEYRKAHYKSKSDYTGMPMNMTINPDGTTTILMEEMTSANQENYMGSIGIIDYNKEGAPTQGYVVQKMQESRTYIAPLSHDDMRKNKIDFERASDITQTTNPGFYSCRYYSTAKGRFVIFNDHPKNFDRKSEELPLTLDLVSGSNTVCYRMTDGSLSKFYLFGNPNDDFDNRFADISSGNYSETTGDYAVLMVERTGRKKVARIAWVHLK